MVSFTNSPDIGWYAEWTHSDNDRQQAMFILEDGDWVVAQASDSVVRSLTLDVAHKEVVDAWLNKIIMEPLDEGDGGG